MPRKKGPQQSPSRKQWVDAISLYKDLSTSRTNKSATHTFFEKYTERLQRDLRPHCLIADLGCNSYLFHPNTGSIESYLPSDISYKPFSTPWTAVHQRPHFLVYLNPSTEGTYRDLTANTIAADLVTCCMELLDANNTDRLSGGLEQIQREIIQDCGELRTGNIIRPSPNDFFSVYQQFEEQLSEQIRSDPTRT
ncbi:hypothetical protein CMO92_02125 [Candidatus Woesearchaeota archaeon]|nr:hypothetical protein [Candidatus Woesearchaeota archaeon]|tara:strand:+ start:344 stop:925 length:582 start_codon:yes stop_codon:yes gene_type:complete